MEGEGGGEDEPGVGGFVLQASEVGLEADGERRGALHREVEKCGDERKGEAQKDADAADVGHAAGRGFDLSRDACAVEGVEFAAQGAREVGREECGEEGDGDEGEDEGGHGGRAIKRESGKR